MNLIKLFDVQHALDEHIEKEHPRRTGENRLEQKILALQVELGELANELPEVFKFWSNKKNEYDEALKEYVDVFHFILSIGMEYSYRYGELLPINLSLPRELDSIKYESIAKQFNYLFQQVGYFYDCVADCEMACGSETEEQYEQTFKMFIGLGEMLGFTWEQIEQAYYAKNQINHERQNTGY